MSDTHTDETAPGAERAGVLHRIKRLIGGVFGFLASPKLTTALIVAAMAIVLLGTLAQVYMDIWEVVNVYFRSWVAWVDFKVIFPPTFFPWTMHVDWDSMGGKSFPFPGGALIGLCLVINLTAAHIVRFRMQARGLRLVLGLLVLHGGMALTWLVIETGHNHEGVQGEPLLAWSTLWLVLRIGLIALWLACLSAFVYVLVRLKRKRMVELALLGLSTLGLGLLLAWLFAKGEDAALTDSSLRILYHLIQGELAAAVLLVACVLLFYKRAGIALLHGGVGLLMFGEFFVSYFAEEQQMTFHEGQTVSYTRDIRSAEVVITTLFKPGRANVVAIPTETNGRLTRFVGGGVVPLDGPPFNAEIVGYHKNSTLRPIKSDEPNLATMGMGTQYVSEEAPPAGSAQRGRQDVASAYVKLIDREKGEDIGTFLVSQHFPSLRMLRNSVTAGDKTYGLELRFKRSYKPYKITLLDVRKDDYTGTTMPRNYSSRVKLVDESRNVEFETKIWMNNPLRYAGETFYQSGYNSGRGGESSTLQVVKNTGWMIPYVSCMIVATGMLAHFLLILLRFLRRATEGNADESEESEESTSSPAQAAPSPASRIPAAVRCLVPLAVVVLGAAYVADKAFLRKPVRLQMNLEQFGELPLMYEGRVKPFETLARNSLRILSNRATFVDGQGQKQPAIRWLLDVIARPRVAEKHQVFRIDNLEVLKSLGLERRKGFRYSWSEIRAKSMEFQRQVMAAQKQPIQQRTLQQRRLLELRQRVDRYRLLADAFRPLPLPPFPTKKDIDEDREKAVKRAAAIGRLMKEIPATSKALAARQPPLAAPVGPTDQPWEAYAIAKNQAYSAKHFRQEEPPLVLTKLSAVFEAYEDDNPASFNQAVAEYRTLLASQPPKGLDVRITSFEAFFNRFAPFYHAIPLYAMALVLTAFAWLSTVAWPRLSALMRSSTFWLIVLAFAVHTFALGARVVISGRPPVTNLYSSAVFVGWGCVGIGLLLEMVFRLGIGNLVAAVSGIGTLIIAHFLAGDGDTIKVLQAVLDTQFWLTVHVITVTLGYSATFLAGLLGIVLIAYVLGKPWILAIGRRMRPEGTDQSSGDSLSSSDRSEVVKILAAMIYGTVCFAAFFSLVGTVLGGLWADDSWGRFWGWDPKENGALMVVLWNALVLHARWSRMAKERGLALLAIGGNIVTAWSWFGVNELGVGLHSYGFTEGAARTLWLFWISQLAVIGLGILPALIGRGSRGAPPPETSTA